MTRRNKTFSNKLFTASPTQTLVFGFVAVILVGGVLLSLPTATRSGASTGFIDALFTSTSAVCVTGLVVVDTYSHWSIFGQLVILGLIQIGGLGFMTFATLFSMVLRRRISLKERLIIVESLNQYSVKGVVRLTRNILFGTPLFELAGAVVFAVKLVPEFGWRTGLYKSIFHSISAFCNAGFDLMGQKEAFSSLTSYSSNIPISLITMFLIVVGGLGFAVWDDIYRNRNFRDLSLHTKLVVTTTVFLLITAFIFFFTVEYNNPDTLKPMGIEGKVTSAMFQSVTPRTAGFNTINQADMKDASIFSTMILMFVGGSPGSTAGGIKTTTAGILVFAVISTILGKNDTELFKRRISYSLVIRAFSIVLISLLLVVLVTVTISFTTTCSLTEALFEAFSAFGTVGLSLGITPILGIAAKFAVITAMFFGRVGVLTIALAMASGMGRRHANLKYREGRVMIG